MAQRGTADFCLPDLGEGLEEAELIEWCVHVGQRVEENDTLAKMETAKAVVEVPSPRPGVIAVLHGSPGQMIKVGSPLVTYQEESTPAPKVEAPQPRADAGSVVGDLSERFDDDNGKVKAAPAVRSLAKSLNVNLESIHGSGIGGRITSQDVQAASMAGGSSRPIPRELPGDDLRIAFRGVRKTIADHLRQSVANAVHFTVMDEADVTALEVLRRKLVAASNEKITLLAFVASAVCRVLTSRYGARLNSTVDDEKQEIVQHRSVHLGIATDTEAGLMVPVIRDAHRLGVMEIGRTIAQLAAAARERSIPAEQLSGSTFTISNFGSMAGRFGTPIINYPEAAILAMGRAREGVVARSGMLGVGKLLPLSMSADHRVIDGATAATALAKIIELLEKPDELLSPA